MKFNFLPKVTIPKRIKVDTLTNKGGREGDKIRGQGEWIISRLCKFRGGNWNLALEIIEFIQCLMFVLSFAQLIIKNAAVLLEFLLRAESKKGYEQREMAMLAQLL